VWREQREQESIGKQVVKMIQSPIDTGVIGGRREKFSDDCLGSAAQSNRSVSAMPSDGSWKSGRLQHGARRIHCYRLGGTLFAMKILKRYLLTLLVASAAGLGC